MREASNDVFRGVKVALNKDNSRNRDYGKKAMFDLSDKVALVTGAGAGMGREICNGLAEFGANVACIDIKESKAKETAEQLEHYGQRSIAIKADAFDKQDIGNMVNLTLKAFGAIDIVFAHAAIVNSKPVKIHDVQVEEWDEIVSRYIRGIYLLMKNVFPIMMQKKKGSFITTAAGTAIWPLPPVGTLHMATPYIVGKSAAIMLTKLAVRQYGEYGIRANIICPGYHRTHFADEPERMKPMEEFILNYTPLKRVGMPSDIKGLAVYLASEASSFINGQIIVEDGGFMA